MSKKLNVSQISNELTGQSAFFKKKSSPTTEPVVKKVEPNVNKLTSKQVNKITSKHDNKLTSTQVNSLTSYLNSKATKLGGFRSPVSLLEFLDDTMYKIKKNHKIRVTKNSIIVLALAKILIDYEENGVKSHLYKELIEGK